MAARMSAPKLIKRYANRKLYDTDRSCYVTLEEIAAMIRVGDEVRVIDNKSGEDLTNVTLAQIIFETEKKSNFMPLSLLRRLIQDGGVLGGYAREKVDQVQARAQDFRETAQKLRSNFEDRIDRVRGRRSLEGDSAVVETVGLDGGDADDRRGSGRSVSEMLSHCRTAYADLQRNVEGSIKSRVGSMARYANLNQEMKEIESRLHHLEARLESLPADVAAMSEVSAVADGN